MEEHRRLFARRKTLLKYRDLWKQETTLHRYTFYFLFLLGFGLRLGYLFQTVRYDEAYTYIAFVGNPLRVGLSFFPVPNNHLLHTLLAHVSTTLFGNNVVALRLPAFIAGVLVVPIVYLAIRRIANKEAGLIAMALVAVSSNLISYSVQARGYMIQTLLLLLLIVVGKYLIDTNGTWGWVAFTAISVLGLYTIPTFLYFFPPVMIWAAVSRFFKHYDRGKVVRRSLASLAGIAGLTLLLYTPVFLKSGFDGFLGDTRYNSFLLSLQWGEFLRGIPKNLNEIRTSMNLGIPLVIQVFLMMGLVVGILLYHRLKAGYNLPLILLAWIAAVYLIQKQVPYARVFVPMIPVYLGFASVGIEAAWRYGKKSWSKVTGERLGARASYVTAGLVLIILVCSVVFVAQGPYQLNETGGIDSSTMRDARNVTAKLKEVLKPGDMVFASSGIGTFPLEYYFRQYGIPVGYLMERVSQQSEWEENTNNFVHRSFFGEDAAKIKRVVFVTAFKERQMPDTITLEAGTRLDLKEFVRPTMIYDTDWAEISVGERIHPEAESE